MIKRHEFIFNHKKQFPSYCIHCGKVFRDCVNRNGTYNSRCVKRKGGDLNNGP